MLFAIVPIVVMILGLLLWVLAQNPLVKQIGQYMFVVGLFFSVQVTARLTVQLP